MELMNFNPIMSSIESNNFYYVIPPTVKSLSSSKKKNDENQKRQKTGGKRVQNNAMVEAWKLRPNKSYDTVFKDKVKSGPTLSLGYKGCQKWHNRDNYFDYCNNVKSHGPLYGDDFTKFDNYCKQCRGE